MKTSLKDKIEKIAIEQENAESKDIWTLKRLLDEITKTQTESVDRLGIIDTKVIADNAFIICLVLYGEFYANYKKELFGNDIMFDLESSNEEWLNTNMNFKSEYLQGIIEILFEIQSIGVGKLSDLIKSSKFYTNTKIKYIPLTVYSYSYIPRRNIRRFFK